MRASFVLAVRQLQPPVVDLDRATERRGGLHRAPQRAGHDEVDLAAVLDVGRDRRCLLTPSIVEILVEATLESALQIRLGPAVAHEDQHRRSVAQCRGGGRLSPGVPARRRAVRCA